MSEAVPKLDLMKAHEAYDRFRELTRAPANKNTARRFYKFLGARDLNGDDSFQKQWNQVSHTEVAHNRVEWLTGPNAKVLYEIWKAQNEDAL